MYICCEMGWAVDCASTYGAQRFEGVPVLDSGCFPDGSICEKPF